jgi:hypothetical protein
MGYIGVTLGLSAIVLLFANGIARGVRFGGALFVVSTLIVLMSLLAFPVVALQGILFVVASYVWRVSRRGPSSFLSLSCGATLIAYGLLAMVVLPSLREFGRLRALYPYESMEERLPVKTAPISLTLSAPATERLVRLEAEIPEHGNGYRTYQLRTLHEETVELFVSSAGFGFGRMLRPTERGLRVNLRREPIPLQPGSQSKLVWSPGDWERPTDSIGDFVNSRGFGFFKDRQHVAGFETHQFSAMPELSNRWKVRTLELVSLLLHDKPEVYLSDHLPQMDRAHKQPTRPLDGFERFGLQALEEGDDMFITKHDDSVRMLGAVRSNSRCVACHGNQRGELLGAFSYVLTSASP